MKTILLLILLSLNVLAKDSAGARGGGTGISCDEKIPIMMEEYLASLNKKRVSIPSHRFLVKLWMKTKIRDNEFYNKWEKVWEDLGQYDSWTISSNTKEFTSSLNSLIVQNFFDQIQVQDDFSIFGIENDDYIEVPKNCQKKQLSIILKNYTDIKPYDVYRSYENYELTKRTKRILELHESFFILGMKDYEHIFPKKTQNLVLSLITNFDIQKAIESFKKISKYSNKSALYLLKNFKKNDNRRFHCPRFFILLFEKGSFLTQTSLYALNLGLGRLDFRRSPLLDLQGQYSSKVQNHKFNDLRSFLNNEFDFTGSKNKSIKYLNCQINEDCHYKVSYQTIDRKMSCEYMDYHWPMRRIQFLKKALLSKRRL